MLEPTHRLLMIYDIRPEEFQQYYLYVRGEFVSSLQKVGLQMVSAWQVHGGNHPERQLEFVAESAEALREALTSEKFQDAEDRLKTFSTSYRRKVVRFANRYQF
jgi:hypothetical protein